jgi:transposase InsO family protein
LLGNFLQTDSDRPCAIWLADVTDIATDEGWLDLAAVKDMASRESVGWSMADH